jgi:hypothetical protein
MERAVEPRRETRAVLLDLDDTLTDPGPLGVALPHESVGSLPEILQLPGLLATD